MKGKTVRKVATSKTGRRIVFFVVRRKAKKHTHRARKVGIVVAILVIAIAGYVAVSGGGDEPEQLPA